MNKLISVFLCGLFLISSSLKAQEKQESNYDYNEAFGHDFYSKNGTATRSASGKAHSNVRSCHDKLILSLRNTSGKFFIF